MSLKTDTLRLQAEMLDLADALKRIKEVTLPDAMDEGLTVFQRKYLVRVFNDIGHSVEDCLGRIHAL